MSETPDLTADRRIEGTYANGIIRLHGPVDWPEGTRVGLRVETVESPEVPSDRVPNEQIGRVIIAGFGPPGRWVAEIFQRHGIDFVVVDLNESTIARQRELGVPAIAGNITEPEVLKRAGIERAAFLILTIPDEQAVVQATGIARKLNPDVYIVARTTHTSAGMAARQMGANEVVKAEQAVARRFSELLARKLQGPIGG